MIKISGLKCDYCTWRDDTVPYSDYQKSIGRPCPKCGTSLLTRSEYDDCERIIKRVAKVEKIIFALRWVNPLFYFRLIFGDRRKEQKLTIEYPKRKEDNL